jgi:hypothetical protein
VQIIIPESNPLLPPLSEVFVVHRVVSSSPRRRGSPQVSPCAGPGRARVSSLANPAGGRR